MPRGSVLTPDGSEEYTHGVNLTNNEFYEKLVTSDVLPTTSQPAPAVFEEVYREIEAAIALAVDSADHSSPILMDLIPRQREYPTPEEVVSFICGLAAE